MANESIPLFRPGQDISATASAAVTGKRFVAWTGGLLPLTSPKTLPTAAHATAAGAIAGVSSYDAASGSRFAIQRGKGLVVTVTAAAAITALAEVEVGPAARSSPRPSGVAVGRALSAGSHRHRLLRRAVLKGSELDAYIRVSVSTSDSERPDRFGRRDAAAADQDHPLSERSRTAGLLGRPGVLAPVAACPAVRSSTTSWSPTSCSWHPDAT